MFKIYRFLYIDRRVRLKWEIFARNEKLADELASRISKLGIYNLKKVKIGFRKLVYVEIPPYELEQAEIEYVEDCEMKVMQQNNN